MSDIFDHALDAYEDSWARGEEPSWGHRHYSRRGRTHKRVASHGCGGTDHLHYHRYYRFKRIAYTSTGAYLFQRYDGLYQWIPKKTVKALSVTSDGSGECRVHRIAVDNPTFTQGERVP